MRYLVAVAFAFLFQPSINATDVKYPVSAIPSALLKNANVVKRAEEVRFEIVNLHETLHFKKVAYTILNEQGLDFATFVEGYDNLRKVVAIDGALYDAKGNSLKKLKSKDVQDYSNVSSISIMEDNRVKVHSFNYKDYPFTVEYEVLVKTNNTYSLPRWTPQSAEHMAVERSSFTLVCPETYAVRYKSFKYDGVPASKVENGRKLLAWEVKNLTPIALSFASPIWRELTTSVHLAPSAFEMQSYSGNASTWEDMGRFAWTLNKDRDKLPESVLQKIRVLIANEKDKKEQVKLLYEFLQQNTRYISIQLGIGGLQPFEASYVAEKGYGDCKALSNYMYSLLKAVDIKSHYTLVKAGRGRDDKYLMEDFPSDEFNHIILCVPFQKDTMWLECTSQTTPAGYMGSFTGNRKVLLITEEGGKLVYTPKYGVKENLQTRSIKGRLDVNGSLDMQVLTTYKGTQQDQIFYMINELSKDKLKEMLNDDLGLSSYEVEDFKYNAKKQTLPEVDEQLNIKVANYATVTGKRLFIQPNVLNRSTTQLVEEERLFDIEFSTEYKDVDTVEIELIDGYEIESMPQPVSLKTAYGTYKASVKVEGKRILYIRECEQYTGRFAPSEYKEVANFYNTIYKTDRSRIVLVKKQ